MATAIEQEEKLLTSIHVSTKHSWDRQSAEGAKSDNLYENSSPANARRQPGLGRLSLQSRRNERIKGRRITFCRRDLKEWWRTACRQFLFMRIQPYKTLKIHSRRIMLFLAEFLFHDSTELQLPVAMSMVPKVYSIQNTLRFLYTDSKKCRSHPIPKLSTLS